MEQEQGKRGLGHLLAISGVPATRLIMGAALSVAAALLEVIPYLAVYCVLAALAGAPLPVGSLQGDYILAQAVMLAALAAVTSIALGFISSMLCHTYAFSVICETRRALVRHLGKLPIAYFRRNASGKVIQVVQTDVDQLEGFWAHQLPDLVGTVALLLFLAAGMVLFDPVLALVALGALVIGFMGQFIPMIGLLRSGALKDNFDALERISAAATEYVHGMPSIKMFGQTPRSFAGFQADIEAYRDFTTGMSRKVGVGVVFFRTVVLSVATFVAPVGVAMLMSGPGDGSLVGTVLFFLVFAPAASVPVCKLRSFSEAMNMLGESVGRIEDIFGERPFEAGDAEAPTDFSVEFAGVGFSYGGEGDEADTRSGEGRRRALESVSFRAPAGELTAIVGPSGSGKSTAAQMVCRFWDPDEGSVRIGGVDVRGLPTRELSRLVSFVFQDSHVFRMNVMDNIRLGRPDASDEEVLAAARAACCDEFAAGLPDGYRTVVGDGGVGLSGGERQRIAIARAILKDAPVLVLDEPTSAMDADTERSVQQALSRLAQGRTVIMVAHRLRTVMGAGQILVMDRGRIVERGSHDELLAHAGVYRKMWEASEESASWDAGR